MKNSTSTLLLFVAILSGCSAPYKYKPEETLPGWHGDSLRLIALDGLDPYMRTGPDPLQDDGRTRRSTFKPVDTSIYLTGEFESGKPLPLPNGWHFKVEGHQRSCLKLPFKLVNPSENRTVSAVALRNVGESIFMRYLSCIGGSAAVYQIITVSDRYVAFVTSFPGTMIFDTERGEMLDEVITQNGRITHLYRTESGSVIYDRNKLLVVSGRKIEGPLSQSTVDAIAKAAGRKPDDVNAPFPSLNQFSPGLPQSRQAPHQ